MPAIGSILPKVLVFGASVAVGAVVASVAVSVMQDRGPVTGATERDEPQYVLAGADTPAGPGPVVAFNESPAPASEAPATAVPTLSPDDLNAAAAALLGGEPQDLAAAPQQTFTDPTGFPRIRPITQFDGGSFEGANCTLASGAMLARLARGVVTSGTILRGLQDDQDGGTGLNDLDDALYRGYGITFPYGLLRPEQLKNLLAAGYGAVIQGVYGEIPTQIRLQKNFTGGHAIYLDGYYPGNPARGIPEAYYVIDPLGRPHGGYQGDWWPASIVDDFALAWGGGRIAAMWAFPPGGTPPDVVGPDVLPIPPDPTGPPPTATPEPTSATPSESPTASASAEPTTSPTASPGGGGGPVLPPWLGGFEPGTLTVELPPAAEPPVGGGVVGGLDQFPIFDICLINPSLPSCPSGLPALFPAGSPPILQFPLGPTVNVVFVDSDRANQVMVGFTTDPPATADVKFWIQGASPGVVGHASAMSTLDLLGSTVTMASLDVKAATTYEFQVVAGDGLFAGYSEIGTFTTGSGVESFSVALSSVATPSFGIGSGFSPYTKQEADKFLYPMVRIADLGTIACGLRADYGGTGYCLDQRDLGPASRTCVSADVSYDLSGIDGDTVAVRAFPTVEGTTPDGDITLDGVLEASGPNGTATVRVGCLGAGMPYTITIDAAGDDRGVLAAQVVDVP